MTKESLIKITTQHGGVETRGSVSSETGLKISERLRRSRCGLWCCCGAIATIILLALAIGLGVGIVLRNQHHGSNDLNLTSTGDPSPDPSSTVTSNSTQRNATNYWRPAAGTTWQIVLHNSPENTGLNVDVYDIDLFDNDVAKITELQKSNHKVICYFSAGSFENWRNDSALFHKSDYGKALDGWAGENWLNTSSPNVRSIMLKRLDYAASKGCDGVDPDNIDGYEQNSGFNLTQSDSVNYLKFLAKAAHNRGLAIGLKNGGDIVDRVIDFLDWEVNEQCAQYNECELYQSFITQNKPVFHIEYPDESRLTVSAMCDNRNATGFSTVIKKVDLDEWVEYCP